MFGKIGKPIYSIIDNKTNCGHFEGDDCMDRYIKLVKKL